jgi:hypothetical protein
MHLGAFFSIENAPTPIATFFSLLQLNLLRLQLVIIDTFGECIRDVYIFLCMY